MKSLHTYNKASLIKRSQHGSYAIADGLFLSETDVKILIAVMEHLLALNAAIVCNNHSLLDLLKFHDSHRMEPSAWTPPL